MKRFVSLSFLLLLCLMFATPLTVEAKVSRPYRVSGVTLKSEDDGIGITWKGQSKAKGYQIKISTSSKFKNSTYKRLTDTNYTYTAAKDKKTYYVKVRAYKTSKGKRIYGKWSYSRKIKYNKPVYSCNLAVSYPPHQDFIDAFKGSGAYITVVDETVDPNEYDGLVIPGGGDVDPSYYGEENEASKNIDLERDAREMAVIEKFVDSGKPILGICRGGQLLNVYFGGTLYQDIGSDHTNNVITSVVASDDALEDSVLYDCYGSEVLTVCSHHQSIKDIAEGFVVTQYSVDGIIEAMEHESRPIIILQWHPERMAVEDQDIIRYFINEMVCKQVE